MKKGLLIMGIVIAVLVAGFFVYPSFKTQTLPSTETSTDSAASANTLAEEGTIQLSIENSAFSPSEIKIKAGSKLVWTNNDNAPHTITSDSGAKKELDSPTLANGETYEHIFNEKGVFNYHCSVHTGMKGKVVVE